MRKFLLFISIVLTTTGAFAQAPQINSFLPTSGAIGALVTIAGSGFNTIASKNVVFFGATKGTVTSANATSLTVTVPKSASYRYISVTNTETNFTTYSASPFLVTNSNGLINIKANSDYASGANPQGVAVGDLDGDGKPDMVVANYGSNTISVYFNTSVAGTIGPSSFATKVDFTTGDHPYFVAIGDLDSDGKPDIAVTNYYDNSVSVFRNTCAVGSITASSFASKYDYGTASQPSCVAIGDVNGDGKPDLVVSNQTTSTVSVLTNYYSPGGFNVSSFSQKDDYSTGLQPTAVVIADVDGDGKPDIATSNAGSNTISVIRRTINSGFAAAVDFTTGLGPYSIVAGDLNGDGKPDLIVDNFSSNTISVLANSSSTGAVSFVAKQDFTTGKSPFKLILNDLDGDGKLDIATINSASNTVSVFRNTSSGATINYAAKIDYSTGTKPLGLEIADMDGDNRPDIVVSNYSDQTISVFKNAPLPPVTQATGVTVSNINSFSAQLNWTNGSGNTRAVFVSTGTGSMPNPVDNTVYTGSNFGSGSQIGTSGWYCVYNGTGTTVAFNGLAGETNYQVMVVEYNQYGSELTYLKTVGTGNPVTFTTISSVATLNNISLNTGILNPAFDPATLSYTTDINYNNATLVITPTATQASAAIKVNGVSVTSGSASQPITLAIGVNTITIGVTAQDGNFTKTYTLVATRGAVATTTPPVIASFAPASGPIGTSVIITGSHFNTTIANNIVFFGATKATVTAASSTSLTVTVPVGATYSSISVTDITSGASGYSVMPFNVTFANGTFGVQTGTNFSSSAGGRAIAVGDLDGDGKVDVVTVNSTDNTMTVYRNTATLGILNTNSFSTGVTFAAALSLTYKVAIADLDGDGKPEVVVISGNNNIISVFRNLSSPGSITTASFANRVDISTGGGDAWHLTIADIDGDGKADLIAPRPSFSKLAVLRNQSVLGVIDANSFAPPVEFAAASGAFGVTVGDLDGDGKPDIVVSNRSSTSASSYVSVFRNTSTVGVIDGNSLAGKIDYLTPLFSSGLSVADIDGDGKKDIAVTASTGQTVSILRNASSVNNINFLDKVDFATGSIGPSSIDVIDFDGNGSPDILAAGGTRVMLFKNTSTQGNLNLSRVDIGTPGTTTGVATADFDGDGRPDIAAITSNSFLSIFRNGPSVPSQASKTVTFTNLGSKTATINWVNGNGTGRAVFILAGATGAPAPVTNTLYNANPAFGSGTQIDATGWFCVYNGSGTTVNVTGLNPVTTYRIMVVEYNALGSDILYQTAAGTGNPANATTLSDNATLSNFTLSAGTLSPAFASGIVTYTANVDNSITNITVTPTVAQANATLKVNGVVVTSGSASQSIPLNVGSTVVNTSVTAQDGTTTQAYNLNITRLPSLAITSFTPNSATIGATIVITGTNFTGATAVSFGGKPAASYTVDSDTQISAVLGADTSGVVSVVTGGITTTKNGFVYVNSAPVLAGAGNAVNYTENGTSVSISPAVTATDADNTNLASASVSVTGNFLAGDILAATTTGTNITASYTAGTGVLTLSGSDTFANYQTVLRSVTYASTSLNPTNYGANLNRTISFTTSDGISGSNTLTGSVNITGVNSAPALADTPISPIGYTEGGTAIALAPAISASDADNVNLQSATLSISNGFFAGDFLTAITTNTAITSSYNSTTGVLTLFGNETLINYQAVLQSVTYSSTSQNPTNYGANLSRTVSFIANDGTANSTAIAATVNLTTVNNAPVINNVSGSAAYVEGQGATLLTPGLILTDADNLSLSSVTVSINSFGTSGDVFAVNTFGTRISSYNAPDGTLYLTGPETIANYQRVLQSLTYANTGQNPTNYGRNSSRALTISASDGSVSSNTVNISLSITAINTPPVVAGVPGSAMSYSEGGTALTLAPSIVVTDVDNTTLQSATVSLSVVTGDALAVITTGTAISSNFNSNTGVLTLTGMETPLNYQKVLRSLTYVNSGQNPTNYGLNASRNIAITVSDGSATSNNTSILVSIIPINDPPVLAGTPSSAINYNEGGPAAGIAAVIAVTDADNSTLQSASVSISTGFFSGDILAVKTSGTNITSSYDSATGTLNLNGAETLAHYQAVLRSLNYSSTSQNPTKYGANLSRTISLIVNDGTVNSNTATVAVNVTAINNEPVINSLPGWTYVEGQVAVSLAPTLVLTDVDNITLTSATITTGATVAGDVYAVNTIGTGISYSVSYDGTLNLRGIETVANYQKVLRTLTFVNTGQNPGNYGLNLNRNITIGVFDGSAYSSTAGFLISVVPINNPPVLGGPSGMVTNYTEGGTAVTLVPAITALDVDDKVFRTASVSISSGFVTGDVLTANTAGTSVISTYSSSTGTLNLSGNDSPANYQAVLRSVTFSNTSQNPTNYGASLNRIVTISANDASFGLSNAIVGTVNIAPVNNAPILTNTGPTVTYAEGGAAMTVASALTAGDADNKNLQSTIVSISSGFLSGDLLTATTTGTNITTSYNPSTGTLTLSGSDDIADYQIVLKSVAYSSASQNPTNSGANMTRTISFIGNDGLLPSATVQAQINILSIRPISITSTIANGTYKVGDAITIQVGFTVAVNVTGSPTLALNSGGTATYTSGSGTNTLTFTYTVAATNQSADLDYAAVSSLLLSGGTITNSGTNASLTLPLPGLAGSLGANKNIVIDGVLPTLTAVSISSNNPSAAKAKSGDVVAITFTASEALLTPAVIIDTKSALVTNTTGNTYTATHTLTATDTEGTLPFNIAFSDIAGNAGTPVSVTTNNSVVVFDKTQPVKPANFTATSGNAQVTLSWTANTESDLAGYKIYAGTTANPSTVLTTVAAGINTYTATGLTNGTTYYYKLSAVDGTGNESVATADINATPAGTQTITFGTLISKLYGAADFNLTATASSGLGITYSSSDPTIASVSGNTVRIHKAGSAVITASQAGNGSYIAASSVNQTLNVATAPLTITAVDKSKIYGATNPTLTVSYSGFVNGDTNTSLSTQPTLNTPATNTSSVGTYAISASGALSSNYTVTYAPGTLTVFKAPLIIRAVDKSKVYGSANPTLTATYTGFVNGDTNAGLTSQPAIATIATNASPVGTYPVTASGAASSNYMITYTIGNLTITTAQLTIAVVDKSKVYGSANPTLTATYTGFVNGDSNASLTVQPILTTTATSASAVGTYAITANGAVSTNYAIVYNPGTLSVTTASIMVTVDVKSKLYGDGEPALTYTFSPSLVTGDSFTGSLTRTTGESVGTYAISKGTLSLSANYTLIYNGSNLTIGAKAVAIAADTKTKSYGDADPALTYTFSPTLVNGDSFTGSLTRAIGENVGAYSITKGSLALSSNYVLTYAGANLDIVTKAVVVTAAAKSKTYGDADPALTYNFSPAIITGDTFTGALARVNGENIGAKAITQGTLALSSNYTLTYTGADLTIGAKAIVITADAKGKTYGDTDPALTYTFSPSLITGDSFTGALARVNGENIGAKAITQGTLALSSNYTLTYTGANLTISAKAITVTADAKTKTYGDADPALTYTFSPGLVTGDSFTGSLTRVTGENSGTKAITQGTLALNSNYVLTYTGADLTIGAKAVAATADAKSKTYGDVDPALTYTYLPALITGDTFTGSLARVTGENIGTKAITQGTLALNSNYALTYTGADLTIGAKVIAVTAAAKTKTYGDVDPALTYTFSPALITGDSFTGSLTRVTGENIGTKPITQGTLALNGNYAITYTGADLTIGAKSIAVVAVAKSKTYGDVDPVLTYTFSPALVTDDTFTGSLARVTGENIGIKAITQGTLALSSNYTLTYTGADLTIGAKAIVITADAKGKTYGDTDPALTYTLSPSLITGDSFTGALARVNGENIGAKAITQGTLALSSNYTLTYTGANLTISAKAITVTADAKTKTYGDADPALTYTFSPGLVTGDSFTGSLTRVTGENSGTKAITQGTLALNSNYVLTYTGADLTIGAKAVAATADAKSKTYGDVDPALTYNFSPALITGDSFTGSLARVTGENIGTKAITQGTLALNSNYALTYTGADLTIGAKAIAVTADAKSKTYGDVDPALTYTFSPSLITGDSFTGSLTRVTGENIGAKPITQGTLALNSNYVVTYTGADLTIGTKAITVTAAAKSKTYGDADPALTYTFSPGLVTGDSFTGSLTRVTGENIGTKVITQGTLSLSSNYNLTYTGADLTIGAKAIAVTADAKSKTYGDVDPALTYTYLPALITGDTFTGSLARVTGENIGTKAITQGTLALNSNYALTYTGADLTIGAKVIAVTAAAKTKTYGDVDPALTYTFSPALITGDSFTGSLTRVTGENIGTKPITQGTLALNGNYAITYTGADLTIGAKSIAVVAVAKSKTYGDVDPVLTYTFSPALVTDDTFTGSLARVTGENIGIKAITQGTLALSSNYTLTYTGADLTIGAKAIVITADAKGKTYGDTDPALTYTLSPSLITGDSFTGALARVNGENIGAKAITQGTLALSSNYTLTYTGANLTISAKAITVTADAKTKTYGDADPALTYTFTPAIKTGDTFAGNLSRRVGENAGIYAINQGTLALGDNYSLTYNVANLTIDKAAAKITLSNLAQTYDGTAKQVTAITAPAGLSGVTTTYNGSEIVPSAAGSYSVIASMNNSNYTSPDATGTLIISSASTALTFSKISNKTYGDATFNLTATGPGTNAITYSSSNAGVATVSGNTVTITGTGATTLTANQPADANHLASSSSQVFTVNAKAISVTADAKTKIFGTADPLFTYTFTPALINGDAFAGSLARVPGETAGAYVINQGTLALNSNYAITYKPANFSVTASTTAIRTVTFNSLPGHVYGDTDFALNATVSTGEVPVYSSSNTAVAIVANGILHIVGAGNTVIKAAVPTNANYTTTDSVTRVLAVDKAQQVINFAPIPDQTKNSSYNLTGVTSSTGAPITFTTSNGFIANVAGNTLNAFSIGETNVIADAAGNANYYSAPSVIQSVKVISNDPDNPVVVHQAISPNGDGINDSFQLEGIAEHPKNSVSVYNKNGVLIYQTNDYDNVNRAFDGHSNYTGALQQAGTYFYVLEYTDNGKKMHKVGTLVIKY